MPFFIAGCQVFWGRREVTADTIESACIFPDPGSLAVLPQHIRDLWLLSENGRGPEKCSPKDHHQDGSADKPAAGFHTTLLLSLGLRLHREPRLCGPLVYARRYLADLAIPSWS